MSSIPPILTVQDACVTFGGKPVFEDLYLSVHPGERLCLIGRNGSGKSTLLKVLSGQIELDDGGMHHAPTAQILYIPQELSFDPTHTIFQHLQATLPSTHPDYAIEQAISLISMQPETVMGTLSGGAIKRVTLAPLFIEEPDLILLDEPTNHLDIEAIEWLEKHLGRARAALLFISHDRAFLSKLSTHTLWLDRGTIRRNNKGYSNFNAWAEKILEDEAQERSKMKKHLSQEEVWLRQGVTARRKRNQGRLKKLYDLRETYASHEKIKEQSSISIEQADASGKIVIEAKKITKGFGDQKPIINDFSIKIQRGECISFVGPNGAGKTTLIKLLTGKLDPDAGHIKLSRTLEVAYFDQNKAFEDETYSLRHFLCGAGDTVTRFGKPMHVTGYLKEYLFDPKQFESPISSLSGGEKSRLKLAKLFTEPNNLLILDEPTNDLDMETLDLLQEALNSYEGTILLISHDRDFIDRCATRTVAFEEGAQQIIYAGGYSDYKSQTQAMKAAPEKTTNDSKKPTKAPQKRAKLTYKDQHELDKLPGQIDTLQTQIEAFEKQLSDSSYYTDSPDAYAETSEKLVAAKVKLEELETRWLELEAMKEALED